MSNNNSIKLVGNLVADPEVKTNNENGKEFAVFRLGVNKSFVKEGSEETADFFRCIVGGNLVDEMKALKKGAFVQVEGEIGTRKYEKDGVWHTETFVRPDTVKKLEAKAKAEAEAAAAANPAPTFDEALSF